MTSDANNPEERDGDASADQKDHDAVCPVCGEALQQESCKVVCRSDRCVYRIVFNCSEF